MLTKKSQSARIVLMLKIRLQRTGRKHEPTFRLVLTDSQNSTKSGRFLEVLGNHDARRDNPAIKKERILHWISKGAKPTDTVHNLLISQKIIEGKKINVLPRKSPIVKEAPKEGGAPSPEAKPAAGLEEAVEKTSEKKAEEKKEETPMAHKEEEKKAKTEEPKPKEEKEVS